MDRCNDSRHKVIGDDVGIKLSKPLKENKSNVGQWLRWARYETIDYDGQIFQHEDRPKPSSLRWGAKHGRVECVGTTAEPVDHTTTLIERYPSEQATNDQTPDLLARLNSRMDSAAEIIERYNEAVWDYRMRIEALEEVSIPARYDYDSGCKYMYFIHYQLL